jgi:hypothetical protein
MRELTDEDAVKIQEIVQKVAYKHMDGSDVTGDRLDHLQKELSGRLEDAGYVNIVDVTPLLDGRPPVVSIEGKADGLEDVERKMYDVSKRLERNEDAPDIEGFV